MPTARGCTRSGAQIAFCPSSNLFLGSGLFGWAAAEDAGVAISLGSRRRRWHEPVDAAHHGRRLQGAGAGRHQAQRLGAAACGHARRGAWLSAWADEIGSLEGGACADLCVWDWASSPVARRRQKVARDLHEKVFAWITLGDERDLVETWVAGECRHRRG